MVSQDQIIASQLKGAERRRFLQKLKKKGSDADQEFAQKQLTKDRLSRTRARIAYQEREIDITPQPQTTEIRTAGDIVKASREQSQITGETEQQAFSRISQNVFAQQQTQQKFFEAYTTKQTASRQRQIEQQRQEEINRQLVIEPAQKTGFVSGLSQKSEELNVKTERAITQKQYLKAQAYGIANIGLSFGLGLVEIVDAPIQNAKQVIKYRKEIKEVGLQLIKEPKTAPGLVAGGFKVLGTSLQTDIVSAIQRNPGKVVGKAGGFLFGPEAILKTARVAKTTAIKVASEEVSAESVFGKTGAAKIEAGRATLPKASSVAESIRAFEEAKFSARVERIEASRSVILSAKEAQQLPFKVPERILFSHITKSKLPSEFSVIAGPKGLAGLEDPGLFVAPGKQASTLRLDALASETKIELTLNPFKQIEIPRILQIEAERVSTIPRDVLLKPGFEGVGEFTSSLRGSETAFITKRSTLGFGELPRQKFVAPFDYSDFNIKAGQVIREAGTVEIESVLPVGEVLQQKPLQTPLGKLLKFEEFTVAGNELVIVQKYKTIPFKTGENLPSLNLDFTTKNFELPGVSQYSSSVRTKYVSPYSIVGRTSAIFKSVSKSFSSKSAGLSDVFSSSSASKSSFSSVASKISSVSKPSISSVSKGYSSKVSSFSGISKGSSSDVSSKVSRSSSSISKSLSRVSKTDNLKRRTIKINLDLPDKQRKLRVPKTYKAPKRKLKYLPSLEAVALNIQSPFKKKKKKDLQILSGLELRPII